MTWMELDKAGVLNKAQQQMFFATYKALRNLANMFPDVFLVGQAHGLLHNEPWNPISIYDDNEHFEAMK